MITITNKKFEISIISKQNKKDTFTIYQEGNNIIVTDNVTSIKIDKENYADFITVLKQYSEETFITSKQNYR